MLPILMIPSSISLGMAPDRDLFVRSEGFEHVCRYVTGLLLSPNKTLQGIHDLQRWEEGSVGYRSMHQSLFEAGWDSEALMPTHRQVVSKDYRSSDLSVISLDWTLAHHEKGPQIFGVQKSFDYVERRYGLFQTVVTATVSNSEFIDGIEVVIQEPGSLPQEEAYLKATQQQEYSDLAKVHQRFQELLHYRLHQQQYRKRTEICLEIVQQIESEGHFPESHYAFDNGVLHRPLTDFIEGVGKHWVSELESSRNVMWQGQFRRIDQVAQELQQEHPKSFRPYSFQTRAGINKPVWAFSKVMRLKRGYGKKRIVIVHETEDLSDSPRFLITDAKHWEPTKILTIWSYRWSSEIFHEFGKQHVGLESAQLRNQEAVNRALRLSCLAQSLLQPQHAQPSKSEKFSFAQGQITVGQKQRSLFREVLATIIEKIQRSLKQGVRTQEILDLLVPI